MVNRGISFGLLQGMPLWVFGLILLALGICVLRTKSWGERGGLVLILIGGSGNMVQRFMYGGVVDPLRLGPYLANNLWDYLIGLGFVVYGIVLWMQREKSK